MLFNLQIHCLFNQMLCLHVHGCELGCVLKGSEFMKRRQTPNATFCFTRRLRGERKMLNVYESATHLNSLCTATSLI